jgi:hypothetical protein
MNHENKPLSMLQKPVKFFSDLALLFTMEGEWILDGLGGIGKLLVASISLCAIPKYKEVR